MATGCLPAEKDGLNSLVGFSDRNLYLQEGPQLIDPHRQDRHRNAAVGAKDSRPTLRLHGGGSASFSAAAGATEPAAWAGCAAAHHHLPRESEVARGSAITPRDED
jgi:hypothetical protein